jgi:hypothetical protein
MKQQLVVVPGQFYATAGITPTTGTERLYDSLDLVVYTAPFSATDFVAPQVWSVEADTDAEDEITFEVIVGDDDGQMERVVVLYFMEGEGVWQLVELNISGGMASATIPRPVGEMLYFVQAVDDSGNVAVALDHGNFFSVVTFNSPPAADAGPDRNENEGTLLNFTGVFTDPNPLDTHTFGWAVEADNGQVVPGGTSQNFSFTPFDNGTYTVTFTVTDTQGALDVDSAVVTVANLPPITDAGPEQTVDEGQQADFVGAFTDPGSNDTHTTTWTVQTSAGITVATGSGLNFSYTPDDDDVFVVTFSVEDDDGGEGSKIVMLTVLNVSPTADAGPDQMALAGQEVTFSGTFTDPGTADTHTFLWEVEASNGQNVPDGTDEELTFTPDAAGTYTLTFTVTDDDGGVGMDTAVLTVESVEETYTIYLPAVHRPGASTAELPRWVLLLLPGVVLGFGRWRWREERISHELTRIDFGENKSLACCGVFLVVGETFVFFPGGKLINSTNSIKEI